MNRNLNILAAEEHIDDGDPKVLQLPNDADPLAIEVCLEDIERIDLSFPKFTDGRAYSQAFCCAAASASRATSAPPARC